VEAVRLTDQVSSSIKEMQTQNAELKDLLKTFLTQTHSPQQSGSKSSSTVEQQQKIEIAELKSELKKIKAMMLDSKSMQSVLSQNTTPNSSWSPSSDSKLPNWMQKDAAKSPLSFDDSYSKILEKAQNRGATGEGSSTTSLEEGNAVLTLPNLSCRTSSKRFWKDYANGSKWSNP
jgi:hypothetical protein